MSSTLDDWIGPRFEAELKRILNDQASTDHSSKHDDHVSSASDDDELDYWITTERLHSTLKIIIKYKQDHGDSVQIRRV